MYEARVRLCDNVLTSGVFRTMSSNVPVAKTVWIDPGTADFPIWISDTGSADGWIRYAMKPGDVLVNTSRCESVISVKNARYVLVDGLTIKGGPARRVVAIDDSSDVRICNCDISGWGEKALAEPFADHKKFFFPAEVVGADGLRAPRGDVYSAAIHVRSRCRRTVVERCVLHDPVHNSVAWRYYHP